MKQIIQIIVLSLLVISCTTSSKNSIQQQQKYSFEDFQKSYALVDAALSPDGRSVYYISNKQKYPMIWSYNLDTKTDSLFFDLGRPISKVIISPSGKYLVILADQSGDENFEIFSLNIVDKKIVDLTNRKGSRSALCGFADDNKTITFMTNARNQAYFDIYKMALSDNGQIVEAPKLLVESNHTNSCGEFSKDLNKYSFVRYMTNLKQEIWIKDLLRNKLTKVSGESKNIYDGASWDKLGSSLLSISNVKTDFRNIVSVNQDGKSQKQKTFEKWNIVQFIYDRKNNFAAYVVNEDGYHKVKTTDSNLKNVKTLNLPLGLVKIVGLDKKAENILLSIETAKEPVELYVHSLKSEENTQVTKLNNSPVPKDQLVDNTLLKIKSEDGVEFSAWLMEPKTELKNGVGVVFVHGGPEDQVLPNYSHYRQYLLNQGFTIIIPNFRGSTGYGTQFQKMVYQDWGGGHIKDLMASRQYLISKLGFDSKKISIIGGSFGGFSVLSSITQHPESYCAAVDIFGPVNLFSFIEAVPPSWKDAIHELVGNPEKDKDKLTEASPYFSLDKVKSPLLVIQGANDPRVKKSESDVLVQKLKSLGRKVDYVVFNDEGHGFSKNENQVTAFVSAAKHFNQYCK